MSAPASSEVPTYRGYRYPAEIISHAVWLYFRFSLSLRDVEDLLAERGVSVTYETIRAWCSKFGPSYAAGLRRRRARVSDKWHLDEVQLKIKGKRHWLWRAVGCTSRRRARLACTAERRWLIWSHASTVRDWQQSALPAVGDAGRRMQSLRAHRWSPPRSAPPTGVRMGLRRGG